MDKEKTGALIAAARKEKNMTQRELAEMLHVSDRAVSKWERAAGFPDVGLLEPLAEALDLNVLDLLRGEEQESPEVTVRQAISVLLRQTRQRTRRRWSQTLASLVLLVFSGFMLFEILDSMGAFLRDVSLEVPVGIYVDGELTGESTVSIEGQVQVVGRRTYVGRFAIDCVDATCREGVRARIRWDAMETSGWQDILFHRSGEFLSLGVEQMLYITEEMQSFGLKLEDGTIIATDPFYVPLLSSGYYYSIRPIFSNQF